MEWVAPLNEPNQEDKKTALLAVKCVHEIQDPTITKAAAQKLDGGGDSGFNLIRSNIEFMDCIGLFELLIHVQNLKKLNLSSNHISDKCVNELCKLLKKRRLNFLNISNNLITDHGIGELCNVLGEEESSLESLNVSGNKFSDEGVRMLCEVLKHEHCKLHSLLFGVVEDQKELSSASRKYICNVLKHENCKLIHLTVLWSFCESSDKRENEFEDISDLCDALRHENCKLESLDVGRYNSYCDGRREQLEKASRVPGFKVFRQ